MISSFLKPSITRVITPAAQGALKVGITPDAVTVIGAVGVISSALYFYPSGRYFLGTLIICVFALSDLFDGTMARLSQKGASKWGSFLDSTIDRMADASIFIGLTLSLARENDSLLPVVLLALVTGILIPYIRAKAESLNIACSGGIAERTERVVIALTAIGLEGLGVPFALPVGMWILSILGVVTVVQRVVIVMNATKR